MRHGLLLSGIDLRARNSRRGQASLSPSRAATSQPRLAAGLAALALLAALAASLALGTAPASAQGEGKHILIYTGTTGFRHTDAINNGRPAVQARLEALGFQVTWEDCSGFGTNPGECRNPDENPRVFTEANLAQYDAIFLLNASDYFSGTGGTPGQLWSAEEEAAIIDFVQNGGGIAANHNATDMGAGQTTWNWWDGNNPNSAVGTTMPGHSANNINATVMVEDHNHLSTRGLPDTFQISDEHYNWARNVRGDHHVVANFDERTYNPGPNAMGQDHPISWCRSYDGDGVNDGTGTPKSYDDGRVWITGIGHNGARYTENGGNNPFMDHLIGGIRWVAGEGLKSDCGGTVWANFTRTVLVPDAHNPIAIDVAADGKVYWTEIGPTIGLTSEGYIKMHDQAGASGNQTTVATIPTRADHSNSEDGVLGMSLEPGFDLSDPGLRDIYVYYSPRNPAWPESGNAYTVGYNQISRFTLNAAGTAIEPGSEQVILRVPKVKLAGNPTWCTGCPAGNGPGHVGGASLVFDSEGNLYLGVGDDVAPGESGHNNYPPLDYRAQEHRDARKTAANTGDLRGKIVRINPLEEIAPGAEPGIGATYEIPAGNMFPPGTANARPEIYAMGFRQPFTVHADPGNPGTIGVGEFCHDNGSNQADRAPAGTCEWNLISEPGFHGWPFCVGPNTPANTSYRWDYGSGTSTGSQYDCSLASLPSDLNYAPAGQANPGPTNPGLANIPGPAVPATIWKKYTNEQPTADFGNLSAGGMQPITGPIYRYDPETAGPGAFPAYYDGSWLINNRGSDNGFWKEVRLREDNNQMLHVHDWLPYNHAGSGPGDLNSLVIGTRFGPDGALYMARFPVGCCRNAGTINSPVQIVKVEFNVQDECLEDTQPPNVSHLVSGQEHPFDPDTYVGSASFTINANDAGCAGVDTVEYRVNSDSEEDWQPYDGPVTFEDEGDYAVDYRATDEFGNTSELGSASFSVVDVVDLTPPEVTATVTGSQTGEGDYIGSATLELEATDEFSFIESIERRVNGGPWVATEFDGDSLTEAVEVQFTELGDHEVDYRATDGAGNTSAVETIAFRVVPEPGFTHSIEGISAGAQEFVTTTAGNHNPVTGLIDRDPTTRWAGGNPVTDAWVEFDLGSPQRVDTLRIAIFNGDTRSYPIQITAGDEPSPTNVVFAGNTEMVPAQGDFYSISLPPTTARYFRLTPTGPSTPDGSNFFGGWEAQLVDSELAPESCTGTYSDEFDGGPLEEPKWLRHTRNGGTPPEATVLSGGQLHMPVGKFELDNNNLTTSVGPFNFIGQSLEAMTADLGPVWQVETQFTVSYEATSAPYGWPNAGLMVWQQDPPGDSSSGPDNNLFRFSITRNSGNGSIFAEGSKDNPPGANNEGTRQQGAGNPALRPAASVQAPITVRMRMNRNGGDVVTAQYAVLDPASGEWNWAAPMLTGGTTGFRMGGTPAGLNLNPTGWTRRDGPGSRIGVYAGSNFDTANPSATLPDADVDVEFFRVTPDPSAECSPIDTERPETTHELDPAAPDGANGWYVSPVDVTLEATDNEGGSGVELTQYRIDGGEWTTYAAPFTVSDQGEHVVEYRSRDAQGNMEPAKSVQIDVDPAAPVTTATLDPASPGPGGTYDGPVAVTLTAEDAASGVELTEYAIDGGELGEYSGPFTVSEAGAHTVTFRSTDAAGNVEGTKSVEFSIEEEGGACTPLRSDEFEGTDLDMDRWDVVRLDPSRLSVSDGALHLVSAPTDIFAGQTGLPNIVVQDLPVAARNRGASPPR